MDMTTPDPTSNAGVPHETAAPAGDTANVAKSIADILREKKAAAGGTVRVTLPVTGIAASYPAFVSHSAVLNASKKAGKDRNKVGVTALATMCTFGDRDERLMIGEINDLLPNEDVTFLIGKLFGSDDAASDEDGEGN